MRLRSARVIKAHVQMEQAVPPPTTKPVDCTFPVLTKACPIRINGRRVPHMSHRG
jgi:hypothetical protein